MAGSLLVGQIGGDAGASQPLTFAQVSITMPDTNLTLTAAQYSCPVQDYTGSLTAGRTVTMPSVANSMYWVYNGTGQTLTFQAASGSGVAVTAGSRKCLRWDGTNMVSY